MNIYMASLQPVVFVLILVASKQERSAVNVTHQRRHNFFTWAAVGMNRLAFALPSMLMRASSASVPRAASAISPRKKVLVLAGPTAVGKSSTALSLCLALNGEIISADSVQLYQHLNVGSNKASASERAKVPHHLLDVVSPTAANFTAGDFFRAARSAIADVHARGRLPVVVGGTMMYVRWLVRGRPATPPAPLEARERVREQLEGVTGDWERGVEILREKDPKRAEALSRNDWYRLARAMEVVETTGMTMTEIPLQGGAPNADVGGLDYDFRCVFLYGDRVGLNRQIDERCEQMIVAQDHAGDGRAESVLEEVARLLCSRELRVAGGSPALAIGYRQTISYLVGRALAMGREESGKTAEGGDDAARAFRSYVETFQAATRGYAKQQMAWFRKEEGFRWVGGGEGAVDALTAMMQLSEEEYQAFCEDEEERQTEIREEIVRQGRLMKTYRPEKKWFTEGGEEERKAVQRADRCARKLADALDVQELERVQGVVTR